VHSNETGKSLEHYSKNPHAMLAMVDGKDSNTPSRGTPVYPVATPYGAPSASNKPPQRLKLVLNASKSSSSSNTLPHTNGNSTTISNPPDQSYQATDPSLPLSPQSRDALFGPLPSDLHFTPDEASLPRASLFRLLRRQLHWATTASTALTNSVASLECLRRTEFLAKELALENALEATHAVIERAGLVSSWAENGVRGIPGQESLQAETVLRDEETETRFWVGRREEGGLVGKQLEMDVQAAGALPLGLGSTQAGGSKVREPWYRGAEWKEKRKEMGEARKAAEKAGTGAAGVLGGGDAGIGGSADQPVSLEELDDEVDDAALLDDADEADEELEAPEAEAEAEADEELGDFEGDEDDEGADAEAMEVDRRGGMAEGGDDRGGVRLSGPHGADGMIA